MALVLTALVIVAVIVIWRVGNAKKQTRGAARSAKLKSSRPSHPYSAVQIAAGEVCCQVAEANQGKVWLSSEAPSLPLEGCELETCHCHYVHLDDRRHDEDRRNPYVPIDASLYDEEKLERKGRGRRSSDN